MSSKKKLKLPFMTRKKIRRKDLLKVFRQSLTSISTTLKKSKRKCLPIQRMIKVLPPLKMMS